MPARPLPPRLRNIARLRYLVTLNKKFIQTAKSAGLHHYVPQRILEAERNLERLREKSNSQMRALNPEEKQSVNIERRKLYYKSPAYAEVQRRYSKSDKGKARQERYEKSGKYVIKAILYADSKKNKARRERYEKSAKGRARKRAYVKTPKAKAARKRYNQSEEGRRRVSKYLQSKKGKEARKKRSKTETGKKLAAREDAKQRLRHILIGKLKPTQANLAAVLRPFFNETELADFINRLNNYSEREFLHIFKAINESRMLYRYKLRENDFEPIRGTLFRESKFAPTERSGQVLTHLSNLLWAKWQQKIET